jgi:hypothetical protein
VVQISLVFPIAFVAAMALVATIAAMLPRPA